MPQFCSIDQIIGAEWFTWKEEEQPKPQQEQAGERERLTCRRSPWGSSLPPWPWSRWRCRTRRCRRRRARCAPGGGSSARRHRRRARSRWCSPGAARCSRTAARSSPARSSAPPPAPPPPSPPPSPPPAPAHLARPRRGVRGVDEEEEGGGVSLSLRVGGLTLSRRRRRRRRLAGIWLVAAVCILTRWWCERWLVWVPLFVGGVFFFIGGEASWHARKREFTGPTGIMGWNFARPIKKKDDPVVIGLKDGGPLFAPSCLRNKVHFRSIFLTTSWDSVIEPCYMEYLKLFKQDQFKSLCDFDGSFVLSDRL